MILRNGLAAFFLGGTEKQGRNEIENSSWCISRIVKEGARTNRKRMMPLFLSTTARATPRSHYTSTQLHPMFLSLIHIDYYSLLFVIILTIVKVQIIS